MEKINEEHINGIQGKTFSAAGQELYDYSYTLVMRKYNSDLIAADAISKTAASFKMPAFNESYSDYSGMWIALLYTSAKHLYIDSKRREAARIVTDNLFGDIENTASVPPVYPNEEDYEIWKLKEIISTLSPIDQKIFSLSFENKSIKEIALIMCESVSYVRTRLHRAQKNIKKRW